MPARPTERLAWADPNRSGSSRVAAEQVRFAGESRGSGATVALVHLLTSTTVRTNAPAPLLPLSSKAVPNVATPLAINLHRSSGRRISHLSDACRGWSFPIPLRESANCRCGRGERTDDRGVPTNGGGSSVRDCLGAPPGPAVSLLAAQYRVRPLFVGFLWVCVSTRYDELSECVPVVQKDLTQ